MDPLQESTARQHEIWKGTGGRGWVKAEPLLDHIFKPLEHLLADAASATSARRVLDVGCGTGATTVAVARRLPADGVCTGLDLSEAMVEAARARAGREGVPARFVCADAETHAFEPASVDLIISRFGVMFFADPVRAFANLLTAASRDAELRCITWRHAAENPFMTTAEWAAEPLLPGVARRTHNEPGQFGLADPALATRILAESGWRQVQIAPLDVPCVFPASELDLYLGCLGPVGRALQSADEVTRDKVVAAVRPAFGPYLVGDEVRFTAACWMISAN